MTTKEKEAIAGLVSNAQKVIACLSRQSTLGFLVDEAFEALATAREAGLIPPVTVATATGLSEIE